MLDSCYCPALAFASVSTTLPHYKSSRATHLSAQRPQVLRRGGTTTTRCSHDDVDSGASCGGYKLLMPTLMFITPDGVSASENKAQHVGTLCTDVLRTPGTLVQVRDSRADSAYDLQTLLEQLLRAGASPERLVANNLTPDQVAAVHPHIGVHVKQHLIERDLHAALDTKHARIVGCAVHSRPVAERALHAAAPFPLNYMQVGAMFRTASHPSHLPAGTELLSQVRQACEAEGNAGQVHIIGVGGINYTNAAHVITQGADGVAVIRYIANAARPELATSELMNVLQKAVAGRPASSGASV